MHLGAVSGLLIVVGAVVFVGGGVWFMATAMTGVVEGILTSTSVSEIETVTEALNPAGVMILAGGGLVLVGQVATGRLPESRRGVP